MEDESAQMENSDAERHEVFGHNTEVTVRGRSYHVQTENIYDPDEPAVTTLVYHDGLLVKKLVSPYLDLLQQPGFAASLEKRVRSQHLQVLSQLKAGKLVASTRPDGRR